MTEVLIAIIAVIVGFLLGILTKLPAPPTAEHFLQARPQPPPLRPSPSPLRPAPAAVRENARPIWELDERYW